MDLEWRNVGEARIDSRRIHRGSLPTLLGRLLGQGPVFTHIDISGVFGSWRRQ